MGETTQWILVGCIVYWKKHPPGYPVASGVDLVLYSSLIKLTIFLKTYVSGISVLHQPGDDRQYSRVMILGRLVTTVQRVSRYCLKQMVEVLPYYGVPSAEEIGLFDPDILIICLPAPEHLYLQTNKPFILWSELEANIKLPVASNPAELAQMLQHLQAQLN